jgi:methionine-rich copper-binding protein CopC
MPNSRTLGRAAAVVALLSTSLLVGATSASAHAGIASSSPANGARLSAAPAAVVVRFAEKITLTGTDSRLIDRNGATVAAKVTAKGRKVTWTPQAPLAAGRYAAAWHVLSADGDAVDGAISFTVDVPNPPGTPVKVDAKPKVPTVISAARPGSRTLFFTTDARSGDVEWTSKAIPEPIAWTVKGNGTTAKATGVLPTSGTWTFTATLTSAKAVTIVTGSVRLGR